MKRIKGTEFSKDSKLQEIKRAENWGHHRSFVELNITQRISFNALFTIATTGSFEVSEIAIHQDKTNQWFLKPFHVGSNQIFIQERNLLTFVTFAFFYIVA